VCGKNEGEGEEERAFSEKDAKRPILMGKAPAASLQANAEKTAEKASRLNAEGQKLKRAADREEGKRGRSNKEKTEYFEGKEEDRGAFGRCARGRAAKNRGSETGQKKCS
jgi:hypothetical protein